MYFIEGITYTRYFTDGKGCFLDGLELGIS
jgi:hypothetical protein